MPIVPTGAWRTVALTLTLLLATLGPSLAHAEAAWVLISDEDGLRVWEHDTGGSMFEFRGELTVAADLAEAFAVVFASEYRARWLSDVDEQDLVEWRSSTEQLYYTHLASPLPGIISPRDIVLVAHVTVAPTRVVVDMQGVDHPDYPPRPDIVRMPALRGTFELTRVDPGHTRVGYTLAAHPGGKVPHWVFNLIAKRLPERTLLAFRDELHQPRYERARREVARLYGLGSVPGPQAPRAPSPSSAAPERAISP